MGELQYGVLTWNRSCIQVGGGASFGATATTLPLLSALLLVSFRCRCCNSACALTSQLGKSYAGRQLNLTPVSLVAVLSPCSEQPL